MSIEENLQELTNALKEYSIRFNQSISEISSELGQKTDGILKAISEINFNTSLLDCIRYNNIANDINWPIFLIDNQAFKNEIIGCCKNCDKNNYPIPQIKEIIYNYFNKETINGIYDFWINSYLINKKRYPIFREALNMHLSGNYYASTSILMCQIYGLITDMLSYVKKHHMDTLIENKDVYLKYYNIKEESLKKEKWGIFQLIMFPMNGYYIWDSTVEYFQKEILCSSDSTLRWEHQPLRNKICHGAQLNFGTIEHSLKSILSIDLLIKLGNTIFEVNNYLKNNIELKIN